MEDGTGGSIRRVPHAFKASKQRPFGTCPLLRRDEVVLVRKARRLEPAKEAIELML